MGYNPCAGLTPSIFSITASALRPYEGSPVALDRYRNST